MDVSLPDVSLHTMKDQVGAALVSLQPAVRAAVLRVLQVAGERREKQACGVSEFSLDEGYLTSSSSTGSELQARARHFLP